MRLVPLGEPVLEALLDDDLATASSAAGVRLPAFFLDEAWLWRIRLRQVREHPGDAGWVVRAAVDDAGDVVGHAGFHEAPQDGVVEVAYTVVPERRGQGMAHALLAALLERAVAEPGVHTVRASVQPQNAASRAVLERAGFVQVGQQVDDEDGLELVLERSAR